MGWVIEVYDDTGLVMAIPRWLRRSAEREARLYNHHHGRLVFPIAPFQFHEVVGRPYACVVRRKDVHRR